MQHLVAHQHHGAVPQAIAALGQLMAQVLITPAIADLQLRNATAQGTQLGEMPAEHTATVKDQHRRRLFWRPVTLGPVALLQGRHMTIRRMVAAWRRTIAIVVLMGGWLALAGVTAGPALADTVQPSQSYRCDGEVLIATLHSGAVDDPTIPNRSGATLPGAFVVLQWQQQSLQLPRTNNVGPPSFTDGKWWWSLEDPDHPDLRLRRGRGDVVSFTCERSP